jgi:hypothetical protein
LYIPTSSDYTSLHRRRQKASAFTIISN